MNIKSVLLISVCLIAFAAKAENNEYVVTGTKTPLEKDKLPFASTVINRVDIEKLQVKNLPELLEGVAGISVDSRGGYGKDTDVRVRGTNPNHVLVIIDGVRIGSATSGAAAFQFIPVDLIERIEIIRGPRSSLWGSDAIGGVIQIFTRKGSDENKYSLNAGIGSEETYKTSGAASGKYNNLYYSGSVSYFDTSGIDAQITTNAKSFDRDGYDNLAFSLRGGYLFDNGAEFDAFILQSDGNTEFDSTSRDETNFRQRVIGSSLSLSPLSFWNVDLRLSESRDEQITFDTVPPISANNIFNTKRRFASIQNDFHLNLKHLLTLGMDYHDDKVVSTTSYSERARDNYGVYIQYLAEIGQSQLTASIRTDENEAFGNEVTGGVGLNYHFTNGVIFYSSYGTAFKTPTFNQLYFPGFGNPDLKPESSESYEAGLSGFHPMGEWDVSIYRTEAENLIQFTGTPLQAVNADNARITGVEGEFTLEWHNWKNTLGLNFIDPEDTDNGTRLRRLAKKSFTYNLTYSKNNLQLGTRVKGRGDSFDNASNTNSVGGFVTVDLLGEYKLSENVSFRANLGNLLDKDYQTSRDYNSLRRNVFFSIYYQN